MRGARGVNRRSRSITKYIRHDKVADPEQAKATLRYVHHRFETADTRSREDHRPNGKMP